jgi:hypothetical protein
LIEKGRVVLASGSDHMSSCVVCRRVKANMDAAGNLRRRGTVTGAVKATTLDKLLALGFLFRVNTLLLRYDTIMT